VSCSQSHQQISRPPAFFSLVDLATVFLFVIFFYEEIWEFIVFLLSNWFMVSVLCDYTANLQRSLPLPPVAA
jgi:phosphatidylglycerophosphate synthase